MSEVKYTANEKFYHLWQKITTRDDVGSKNPLRKCKPFNHTVKVVSGDMADIAYLFDPITNTYSILDKKKFSVLLMEWVARFNVGLKSEYLMSIDNFKKLAEAYISKPPDWAEMEYHPIPFAFKSDEVLCLKRHDFDPIEFDIWNEGDKYIPWFSKLYRMIETNAQSFAARLGSMQFPDSLSRRQAVWMYGPAGAGKSRFQNLIYHYTCGSAVNIGNTELLSQFLKGMIYKSGAFCISESTSRFLESDVFKSITGDGYHIINIKQVPQFQAEIKSLCFAFSNEEPSVIDKPEILSRIIDCRVLPVADGKKISEQEIDSAIVSEMPYIAYFFRKAYEEARKPNGEIHTDTRELKSLTKPNDEELATELVVNNFLESKGAKLSAYVLGEFLKSLGMKSTRQKKNVTQSMRKVFNSDSTRCRNHCGQNVRIQTNIRFSDTYWHGINQKVLGEIEKEKPQLKLHMPEKAAE